MAAVVPYLIKGEVTQESTVVIDIGINGMIKNKSEFLPNGILGRDMSLKITGKKYKYIDHPSDIGLEFYGDSLEELFENAAAGMFSIMCDLKLIRPVRKSKIKISEKNADYEDLLISWLEKLLYRYEVNNILYSEFKVNRIEKKNGGSILEAEIGGEKINPGKHKIKTAIKAPTYHTLEIKKEGSNHNWKGRIIFDV